MEGIGKKRPKKWKESVNFRFKEVEGIGKVFSKKWKESVKIEEVERIGKKIKVIIHAR